MLIFPSILVAYSLLTLLLDCFAIHPLNHKPKTRKLCLKLKLDPFIPFGNKTYLCSLASSKVSFTIWTVEVNLHTWIIQIVLTLLYLFQMDFHANIESFQSFQANSLSSLVHKQASQAIVLCSTSCAKLSFPARHVHSSSQHPTTAAPSDWPARLRHDMEDKKGQTIVGGPRLRGSTLPHPVPPFAPKILQ